MEDLSKFYLKDSSTGKTSQIQLRAFINKSLFRYGIGYSIYPELWDQNRQFPTKTKSKTKPFKKDNPNIDIDLENIGTRIANLRTDLKKELSRFADNSEIVDFDILRKRLDEKYKTVKKSKKAKSKLLTLNEYVDQFIKEIQTGDRTYINYRGEHIRYSHGTIKTYKGFKVQFDLYQKSKRKKLDFDDINIDVYNDLIKFFSKKDYTTNSIGKLIKTLKTILRAAHEEKLHSNTEYQRKGFKTLKTDVTEVYLNEKEIERLFKLKLSKDKKLDLVRDVFLVGCYTGLRFSDYSRIRPIHINGKEGVRVIEIITKKTGDKVIIPIRPELEQILSKYNYELPKTYEQLVNRNIKIICEMAKINEGIEIEKLKKGLTVKLEVPKYEMVKTHTARRSAATLMYKANIPTIDIMKITGHRSEKNLLKYIKVTKEETAIRLSGNSFFQGKMGSNG